MEEVDNRTLRIALFVYHVYIVLVYEIRRRIIEFGDFYGLPSSIMLNFLLSDVWCIEVDLLLSTDDEKI